MNELRVAQYLRELEMCGDIQLNNDKLTWENIAEFISTRTPKVPSVDKLTDLILIVACATAIIALLEGKERHE